MKNEVFVRGLADCPKSSWQGGVTYEIAIGPDGAKYSERDFLYRISSAVVELDESEFTPLPDYDRIILSLDNKLTLKTGEALPIELPPLTVYRFDGAAHTHSWGKARDFNLMLRKNQCFGDVEVLKIGSAKVTREALKNCLCRLFFCAGGEAEFNINGSLFTLKPGESIRTMGEEASISGNGLLIEARVLALK